MRKLIIAVSLMVSLISIPPIMAAGGQNVPNHQQWKRVEQWNKNQSDRFKAMEEEVAMSFRNSELERQNDTTRAIPAPVRKR
ncbi:MAG: hypothetical protein M0T73_05185 [Deltaproteobacteria bacterium]|nr:hypothetical protein [Deltaproteobacteria bacterium]